MRAVLAHLVTAGLKACTTTTSTRDSDERAGDQRPSARETAQHGPAALGDNELVALVLGSGRRHLDALAMANELLAARDGLHGLSRSSPGDLAQAPGIGPAKAAQILAAVELGRRTLTHAPRSRVQLLTPRDTVAYLMPTFGGRPVEQFGIVLLDTKYRAFAEAHLEVEAGP